MATHYGVSFEERSRWERRLLFGIFRETEIQEELVGQLIAVAPGIVVLDADLYDFSLSGTLRAAERAPQLFASTSFLGICNSSLQIWPSTFPEGDPRYETCPVWMGISLGGDGTYLGIDPGRWSVLEPWLNKWLRA